MDQDAERAGNATTVTLRWDEQHVALLKQAAARIGVPLSSYAKLVLHRQALLDTKSN